MSELWIPEATREALQTRETRMLSEAIPDAVEQKEVSVLEVVRYHELLSLAERAPNFVAEMGSIILEAAGEQADDVMAVPVSNIKIFRKANNSRFIVLELQPDEYLQEERDSVVSALQEASGIYELPEVFDQFRWQVVIGVIPRGTGITMPELYSRLTPYTPNQVILDVLHTGDEASS